MQPRRHWQDMTTEEFSAGDTAEWIAILPVAAIEQHGPHLPLSTDMMIAEGLLKTVTDHLPGELPVTFLPVQMIGKSDEHIASPGTLTLSWDIITRLWIEIGESIQRAGVKKLIIINSHGGNVPIMDIVTRELRVRFNMLAVATGWMRFGYPNSLFAEEERLYGIHGGDAETSLMLHFQPDLVKQDKLRDFRSEQLNFIEEFTHLRGHGRVQFGWQAQDLHPEGVMGNAERATAEKGKMLALYQAERFIELLWDVHRFNLERLWSP